MKKMKNTKKSITGPLLLLALAIFHFSCSSFSEDAQPLPDNASIFTDLISKLDGYKWEADLAINAKSINGTPSFKTTTAALRAFGLQLAAVKDQATVFVPTDEAYAELGINSKNVGQFPFIPAIIANQVVSGMEIKGSELLDASPLFNLLTAPLVVSEMDGQLYVSDLFGNTAKIIKTDFGALNSTTHFIDKVLMVPAPPSE